MYSVLKNKPRASYSSSSSTHTSRNITMKAKIRFFIGALVLLSLVWFTYKQFQMSGLDQAGLYKSVMQTENININELFHVGKCLLALAGQKIVEIRLNKNENIGMNHKVKDNSVVTMADLESHQIIVHTLNHKFKNLRVVSEESNTPGDGTEAKFDAEFYSSKCDDYIAASNDDFVDIGRVKVFIDPLDATQEYSENLVDYVTVMFCVVIDGDPRAGIIHNPFKNTTVSSFLNEDDEEVTEDAFDDEADDDKEVPVPKKPKIIVSRSHTGTAKAIIEKNLPNSELVIAAGSGYKTLQLLNKKADLYLHTSNIYKWDICAPNAILNARGGELTNRQGEKVDYKTKDLEMVPVADGIIAALDNHDTYLGVFRKV